MGEGLNETFSYTGFPNTVCPAHDNKPINVCYHHLHFLLSTRNTYFLESGKNMTNVTYKIQLMPQRWAAMLPPLGGFSAHH